MFVGTRNLNGYKEELKESKELALDAIKNGYQHAVYAIRDYSKKILAGELYIYNFSSLRFKNDEDFNNWVKILKEQYPDSVVYALHRKAMRELN